MTLFARIEAGEVAELVTFDPDGLFNKSLTWVDASAATGVAPGWIYDGKQFAAPAAPTLTPAQQAAALIAGGLAITSTGTAALSATYPCDAAVQAKAAAIEVRIAAGLGFPGGASTMPWKDAAGAWHELDATQFTAIAGAISVFVAACDLVADGYPGAALPAATATIA